MRGNEKMTLNISFKVITAYYGSLFNSQGLQLLDDVLDVITSAISDKMNDAMLR